jgi:hypothetical protein
MVSRDFRRSYNDKLVAVQSGVNRLTLKCMSRSRDEDSRVEHRPSGLH